VKISHDGPLSKFAYKINVRRYSKGLERPVVIVFGFSANYFKYFGTVGRCRCW